MDKKEVISRISLLIAGLLLGVLVSELIAGAYIKKMRLDEKLRYLEERLGHYDQVDIGSYNEELGWGFKPETEGVVITSDFQATYSINSDGIRDRAVWGYGMDQAFLQLKRDGFKYKPHLVILLVIDDFLKRCGYFMRHAGYKPRFILNDDKNELILQDMIFLKSRFGGQPLLESDSSKEPGERRYGYSRGSRLLTLISYCRRRKIIDKRLKEQDRAYWGGILNGGLGGEGSGQDVSGEDLEKLIPLLLEKYKDLCRVHKADFLVTNIDSRKIDYLAETCHNLGISYLDISGELNRASKSKPLRFDIDPHYNQFAHGIIGEYLSEYLKERYGLIKKKGRVR